MLTRPVKLLPDYPINFLIKLDHNYDFYQILDVNQNVLETVDDIQVVRNQRVMTHGLITMMEYLKDLK